MSTPPPPPSAALPERVGPYRPRKVLGRGGMATVYLAEGGPRSTARGLFALKVPHASLSAQPSYVQMFLREAELASQIDHPHVCRVFAYGRQKGVAYLAMEYLRGRSLAWILKRLGKVRDPARHGAIAARLLADACEGLQAIHEHGRELVPPPRVVHRDISPENLFLTHQGFVKIIDFGLAKVETTRDKTAPGIVKGKLSYIAPELLLGDVATARSDLWSLGVVAWELLTGQRLFHEQTDLDTVLRVQKQVIARPSSVLPGLPRELDRIVMRALQRDPANRYRSAAEFAEALWAFLAKRKIVQHSDLAVWLSQAVAPPVLAVPWRSPRGISLSTLFGIRPLKLLSEASRSLLRWKSSRIVRRSTVAAVGIVLALAFSTLYPDVGRRSILSATTASVKLGR
jgi:serine/threonine protein kinase